MAFVVACREDACQEVLVHDLEARAVLLRLVAPDDEAQAVARAEGLGHVPAELVAGLPAGRGVHAKDGPLVALTVLDGVGPHDGLDPAELAGVEALLVQRPRHVHQVLEVPDAVAQAAMHGEHAAGDGASQGQVGEDVLDQGVDALATSLPSSSWHSSLNPYLSFISRSSWLPLTSQILCGMTIFMAKSKPITASWCIPRSTKSPLKTTCRSS
mmetsp:Transcript_78080/g.242076  ORF Transcript_78080/g.242076 Transcript_78080/m.242076 type:complete len:213 (-) Transcript_78080:341-979(-)